MVSAIAGRLRRMGLRTDAIVGIQVANTVESVLTLLGVLRAGLIAMPLPLLWRRADAVAALNRVGVSALIVSGRVAGFDHYELAMQIAAEVFPVRFVCGYGADAPDGIISFDDLFTARTLDPLPTLEEERAAAPGPAAHLAVITWDVCADGLVPVARSHAELIAGGLALVLESGLRAGRRAAVHADHVLVRRARHRCGAVAHPWRHAGAASAVRSRSLPHPDRHVPGRHRRRAGPARSRARRDRAFDGERGQGDRRLARARADRAGAALAREQSQHGGRAGVRRDRVRRQLPRRGRLGGRYPLRRRPRPARRRHRGRDRDRGDGPRHGGAARTDGAARAVSAGRGARRPALF